MKLIFILALAFVASLAQAVTINAVYFGQTHVLKATDSYFGLVGNREALIKVHVTDPAAPASPAVSATLSLNGQTLVLPLTGPATLPSSIPDGPGVVQHSFANTFTGYIPAAWVKKGLQITVNAGTASTSITNLDIGAPTKVIMTMFDVQYFADTNDTYPANTFNEIEAKWPVADLEVRRLGHIVFPELVIPPRQDVGTKAVRIKSKAEYFTQTNLSFDGEQSAALAWNGALKRAAGRSGRWSLYYLNVYNAYAGGQAGGFAGVGSGTSVGILHHELGHALSLPHWGDSGAYPYKGAMYGIQAPAIYNGTHAGPAWAFHLPTHAFIPPTVQSNNVGGNPAGTYKADPMQGGGTGFQEPAYLLNHFSDYSVNQMKSYLEGHVVVWNSTLNSYASWNQTAGDYTTTVTNNGVQFPTTRDVPVISIMASVSGANPGINMVYPPIGPYTSGLIRLFDPTVPADRTAAQSIYAPTNGCDYCVRVVQGGVTKTYMLAASNLSTADPYQESSLITEAINLPASGGTVTKIELLSTPNAEDVGLPANPTVLYTWAPLMPEPGAWDLPPTANSSSAITMTASPGEVAFGFTGGTVEYQFTETTGNPGATDSAWQTNRSYTDTGLTAGTQYSYTVAMRAGTLTTTASAPASATTPAAAIAGNITVDDTQTFALQSGSGYKSVTGIGTFNPGGSDKLVVVVAGENANNDHFAFRGVTYNSVPMTEVVQQTAGTADGAVAIYYLDNPGPIAGGINVSGYNPNGGMGTAYALSGTRPGFGAFNSKKGGFVTGAPITTSANKSLVIAALENSNGGTPTANAPLTQTNSGSWGGNWGSHASGYVQVATPAAAASAFTTPTSSTHSINIASVEFLAQTTPGSTWVQTAGGAQSWTTGANWILGSAPSPQAGDTVDFSTVNIAANTTVTLGADRTAELWKFGDTAGAETWTVNSGNTITLAGTTPIIEVVNNSAQLNCVVVGTAGLTKTGTGDLILNASNTYTGATRINEGTLQATTLANGGSNSSIGSSSTAATNLILNGGTLEYIGAGGGTNRLFSLQASSTIVSSGTGAVNFTNASAIGFNSGTAAKTLTLDGSNTGSNNITAIIGDNTGATSLTKSGAGTWVLSGANTYSGSTIIDNGTLRITTASPSLGGGLTFGSASGSTNVGVFDLSAASATLGGALLVRTDSATPNAISIGSGRTLQLGGSVTVGYNSAANSNTRLNVTGLGTLSFGASGTPTNANVQIGNGATSSISNTATMDLSTLSAFYSNLGTGTFRIGSPTNGGGVSAGGSTVILAANSTIQADKLLLASPDASSSTQSLKLGSGTNVLNVNTIHITGTGDLFSNTNGRSTGSLTFNGATGSLTLRGLAGGTSRSDLNAGWSNMNTANGPTGTFDTTGHAADLRIGTMTIGRRTTNSAAGTVSGLFNFNQGTLDADNLIVALMEVGASSSGTVSLGGGSSTFNNITNPIRLGENLTGSGVATGTLNISGLAMVNVAASGGTSIRLANATVAGAPATGNLNLNGGTLTVAGDILRGATTGTSNATVKLSGGTLNMNGNDLGAAGAGALTFNAESGTLQNVASINGTGGLTKTTSGTLTLAGTNAYTGVTNVTAGVITLGSASALGTAAGNTVIGTGAEIFAGTAVSNTTIAEPFNIAGTGVTGAIHIGNSITGITFSGAITLGADARIQADGSTSSSFTGGINTNGFALTFNGSGTVVVGTNGISGSGSVIKNTGGITTFNAVNTYTGNTIVSAGTLALADNAQLKFVLGSTSGANNSISGAGTVTLNGDFVIDTSAADALPSGSWTLENVTSLTGPYGSTFTVVGFADAGNNKWTKVNGSKLYTFDETTGVLTLAPAASFTSWIAGFFPGETNPAIIGAGADPDKDGIANAVEMVLGGNPATGMDTALLPTIQLVTNPVSTPAIPAGNYMLFTYRRSDLSVAAGVMATCETDTDLVAPWTVATNGVSGTVVQVDDNYAFTPPAAANTDRVRVYVPCGANIMLFGRLTVLVP